MEPARTVEVIVHDLSLPRDSAENIGWGFFSAVSILIGPEFSGEVLELSGENAGILVKRCPVLVHGMIPDADHQHSFSPCMAFVLAVVPLRNKSYAARFVGTLCTGDRQCEIKIELPLKFGAGETPDKKTVRGGTYWKSFFWCPVCVGPFPFF
jgi:hypothetical protein